MKRILVTLMSLLATLSLFGQQPVQPPVTAIYSGGNFQVTFSSVQGRSYFQHVSTDLQLWTILDEYIAGDGLTKVKTMTSSSPKMFYRLKYTDKPAADIGLTDFDGDGVATIYELLILNTDPLEANTDGLGANDGGGDSDNDGLPDALELHFFGNLTSQNGSDDADTDGLTNAEELQLTNDPLVNEQLTAGKRSRFLYDPVGRLTDASGVYTNNFSYDFEGNINSAQ
jgi:hypothetical protein